MQAGTQSVGLARKALLVLGTKKCVNTQLDSTLKQERFGSVKDALIHRSYYYF